MTDTDFLGEAITSTQTPAGVQALIQIAKLTGAGIIGGLTSKMLGDECQKINSISEEIDFRVECERSCSRQSPWSWPCSDQEGYGIRPGRMYCKSGIFKNYWAFAGWVGEASQCNAKTCGKCCTDKGISYNEDAPED